MREIKIFTYLTDISKIEYLKQSATNHPIDIHYIIQDQSEYAGYTNKIFRMRDTIRDVDPNVIVCFIDAYDVLINGGVDELLRKFLEYDADIVLGAELNSYPEGYDNAYPPTNSITNYNYINSGGYIGYQKDIMTLFNWKSDDEIIEICKHGGDQHYFISYYLENYYFKNIILDSQQRIFQNMYMTDWTEFHFINGRLYNSMLREMCCFIHFNGNSWKTNDNQNIMPVFLEKMELSKHITGHIDSLHGYIRNTLPNPIIRKSLQ